MADDTSPRYRVVEELARGGMGRVSLAVDGLLGREVAVKEIRRVDERALRRFERETRLTARLEHPGIVPVYDLGRKPTGEPFLILRRVRGQSLEAVLTKADTFAARLALLHAFVGACEAVAFAHARGIIHRDLKPGNILVGEFGEALVIDWGLAKDLLAPPIESDELDAPGPTDTPVDATAETIAAGLTGRGAVLGTPGYMSPEQARGQPVDARADVYSLGAILYQLLAGAPPYPESQPRVTLLALHSGPPRPVADVAPDAAPELASIVERAMAREPAARFGSAKELADELRAFQTGRLVQAHSYSLRKLLARWMRRHAKLLLAAGIFAGVAAVGGAIAVRDVIAARDQARKEQRRADREAQAAARTAQFMTGLFKVSDPGEARGKTITARELLDRGAEQIAALSNDALVQAELMETMGAAYTSLGLYQQGESLLQQAARTQREQLGPSSAEAQKSESALAQLYKRRGRFAEAEALVRGVLGERRRALGGAHPDTLSSMADLSDLLKRQGKLDEAARLREEVLAARRRVLGPEHPDTLRSLADLAVVQYEEGRFADSEATARGVLAARTRVLGADHPETLEAMNILGDALREQSRFDEAAAVYQKVLQARRRVLGAGHPATGLAMLTLAQVYKSQRRYDQAGALFREGLGVWRNALGPDHRDLLWASTSYAVLLTRQGRPAESRAVSDEVERALARAHEGQRGPAIGAILYNLGWNAALANDKQRAVALMREGLERGLERGTARSIADDPDLAGLRDQPAFADLVAAVNAKFPK
jgi:tetratricopeptide (TPR) repeat protein